MVVDENYDITLGENVIDKLDHISSFLQQKIDDVTVRTVILWNKLRGFGFVVGLLRIAS